MLIRYPVMDSRPPPYPPPQALPEAGTTAALKPFRRRTFIGGLVTPYLYAFVSLFCIGLCTSRPSAFEAFYSFDPAVIVALAVFPAFVWWEQGKLKSRGYVQGVVVGTLIIPVLSIVALALSMGHP